MRIRRVVAVAFLALAGSVVFAGPAEAKGPKTVTLSGPGIDEPIVVAAYGDAAHEESTADDSSPPYLDFALTEAAGMYLYDLTGARSTPPIGELGPKYTLTWLMYGPSDADPEDWTVVQELYPDATCAPVIHVLPSQYTNNEEGWFDAPDLLQATLAAYTTPEPIAAQRPEPTKSGIALPAMIAGLAAAFTAGLTLGRRRTAT
jgi:hypothetical protein